MFINSLASITTIIFGGVFSKSAAIEVFGVLTSRLELTFIVTFHFSHSFELELFTGSIIGSQTYKII